MIDKKISVSEQVANLPVEAQLLFTWSIPHADDLGLLPYSSRTIKALIVPMLDITVETIGNHLESIVHQGLYEVYEHAGQKYLRIVKFNSHQTLKKDRKPNTYLANIDSWNQVEELGFQMEDNGNPTELKRTEVKRTELKRKEESGALAPTPADNMRKFTSDPALQKKIAEAFIAKGIPRDMVFIEFNKFISYWTELTKSGQKQRWELEKAFDIKRRLVTWFSRINERTTTRGKKILI